MEYDFTLKFRLPATPVSADALVERLGETGCDDAVVGSGQKGYLALNFIRESSSARDAVLSALRDVRRAIAGVELIEAAPDYVGLTDVAELVGVSRQYMRQLMATHPNFPSPVHTGARSQLQMWHLEPVLQWLKVHGDYGIQQDVIDLAHVAQQCNLARAASRMEPAAQRRLRGLVT